jgi:uncharacterized pyridoxal phosphate-containing UPF0001 family protein
MTCSILPCLQLPEDVRWHFIGHLQSNKVKPLLGMRVCFNCMHN